MAAPCLHRAQRGGRLLVARDHGRGQPLQPLIVPPGGLCQPRLLCRLISHRPQQGARHRLCHHLVAAVRGVCPAGARGGVGPAGGLRVAGQGLSGSAAWRAARARPEPSPMPRTLGALRSSRASTGRAGPPHWGRLSATARPGPLLVCPALLGRGLPADLHAAGPTPWLARRRALAASAVQAGRARLAPHTGGQPSVRGAGTACLPVVVVVVLILPRLRPRDGDVQRGGVAQPLVVHLVGLHLGAVGRWGGLKRRLGRWCEDWWPNSRCDWRQRMQAWTTALRAHHQQALRRPSAHRPARRGSIPP